LDKFVYFGEYGLTYLSHTMGSDVQI